MHKIDDTQYIKCMKDHIRYMEEYKDPNNEKSWKSCLRSLFGAVNFYVYCKDKNCLSDEEIAHIEHDAPLPIPTEFFIDPNKFICKKELGLAFFAEEEETYTREMTDSIIQRIRNPKWQQYRHCLIEEGTIQIIPLSNEYYYFAEDVDKYHAQLILALKPHTEAFTRLYGKGENEAKDTDVPSTPATQQDTATLNPLDSSAVDQGERQQLTEVNNL